jgi:hypothetical protein
VERRRQVDGEDLVPLRLGEFLDRRDVLDAGVVDDDVDLTPCSRSISARVNSISSALPKPLSMTSAPCAANARAMPRPMPLVEPVTMADFWLSMKNSWMR